MYVRTYVCMYVCMCVCMCLCVFGVHTYYCMCASQGNKHIVDVGVGRH